MENISGAARTTRWDIISLTKKRPAKIKKKMNEELPFSTFMTEFVCFESKYRQLNAFHGQKSTILKINSHRGFIFLQ